MANAQFRCRGCHKLGRQRTAHQQYCGAKDCQGKRQNKYHRKRYATDPDYRFTARESTKSWLEAQGGAASYYRKYRLKRKQQKTSEKGRSATDMDSIARPISKSLFAAQIDPSTSRANSNAKTGQPIVTTGQYVLLPQDGANSNAIFVELRVITDEIGRSQITTPSTAVKGAVSLKE